MPTRGNTRSVARAITQAEPPGDVLFSHHLRHPVLYQRWVKASSAVATAQEFLATKNVLPVPPLRVMLLCLHPLKLTLLWISAAAFPQPLPQLPRLLVLQTVLRFWGSPVVVR